MALNVQVSQSRSEDWYHRPPTSVAKSVTLSPLSGGGRTAGCAFRGLPGECRPTHIRSDISNISRGLPCTTPVLSPDKVPTREPPKMGEGGNWQCHVCLNVNYPRRTACNRCLAERSKENTQKVAEFVRLKEGFLQMGLDQQTASAAAAAQQAAHSCVSTGGSNGSVAESVARLQSGSNSSGSSSGSVLALDGEGLRLLSYPLEQQQQQRPLFSQASLRRLLQQPAPGLTACPEKQHLLQQQDSCGSLKAPGISSRETSGDLLRSSSSGSNSNESSRACFSDEEAAANSLSRLNAAMRLTSSGNASSQDIDAQLITLRAGMVLAKLLQELDEEGQLHYQQPVASAPAANPSVVAKAEEVLRAALGMLAGSTSAGAGDRQQQAPLFLPALDPLLPTQLQQQRQQQLGYPQMLAHPDEFRNPSSFLKIYGDPLCSLSPTSAAAFVAGSSSSVSPAANRDGNWVCTCCNNINFPRRFRCNKCNEQRGPEGDKIVAEYARAVYALHAERIRMQQLQQQLQQLQQQDMQQMQMQMEQQQQVQQQRQQRHKQRQRILPSSIPPSPLGGCSFAAAKTLASAIAPAAGGDSSVAAFKTGGPCAQTATIDAPARTAGNPAAAADSLCVEQQQTSQDKPSQQEEQQQSNEQVGDAQGEEQKADEVEEERPQTLEKQELSQSANAAASQGSSLVHLHVNDQ